MFDSRAAAPHSGKAEREGGPDIRSHWHPPRLREKYCNSPFMASSVYNVVACFLKTNNLTFPDQRNTYHSTSATKDKGWCWVGIYPPNVLISRLFFTMSTDRLIDACSSQKPICTINDPSWPSRSTVVCTVRNGKRYPGLRISGVVMRPLPRHKREIIRTIMAHIYTYRCCKL